MLCVLWQQLSVLTAVYTCVATHLQALLAGPGSSYVSCYLIYQAYKGAAVVCGLSSLEVLKDMFVYVELI